MSFTEPKDIANRACDHLGSPRIISLFPPDQSVAAIVLNGLYDGVRLAELQRNLWAFATRKVFLRALDTTSQFLTFEAWSATYTYVDGSTGYPSGYVVTYNGTTWVSKINANTDIPGRVDPSWDTYFGVTVANAWNDSIQNTSTTNNTSYHIGEIAYLLTGSAAGNIYVSAVEGNQNEPDVVDAWSTQTLYPLGAVVSYGGTNYQSLVARNFGYEPDTNGAKWTTTVTKPTVSGSWIQLSGASLSTNPVIYPIGGGPANDQSTRNVFVQPLGFLRPAPADPKEGKFAWAGSRSGPYGDDWTYEGKYITTQQAEPLIMLRFVADVRDVTTMHAMFCEGLGARLGTEGGPRIRDEGTKNAAVAYNTFMKEARAIDAIEQGPTTQVEDEWVRVRY